MTSDQIANNEGLATRPKLNYALTADGLQFSSSRDRCGYIGKSLRGRQQWRKENTGNYWRVEDLQNEPAPSERSQERQRAGLASARLALEPGSYDIRNDSERAEIAVAPRRPETCAVQGLPSLLPAPMTPSIVIESTPAEPVVELAGKNIKRAKVETGAVEVPPCKQEQRARLRRRQQKRPVQRQKKRLQAAGKLSAERMLIVIEALAQRPIYRYAAEKAGIHRKTLEYWLKRSEAGDDGYEVAWEGFPALFHEHCAAAIESAVDELRTRLLEIALGERVRVEDGHFIKEVVGPPNGKMLRFYLTHFARDTWKKYREIDPPQTGVLVVGGGAQQPGTCAAASINARVWKSGWKKVARGGG